MQTYIATIEINIKAAALDETLVDHVTDQLADYQPSLAQSQRGWVQATITVPAETLAQATRTATTLVEAAYAGTAIAATVMTELERDAREGWAPVLDLLSVPQAAELLGVSRQRVLQRIDDGTLPGIHPARDWLIPRTAVERSRASTEARSD